MSDVDRLPTFFPDTVEQAEAYANALVGLVNDRCLFNKRARYWAALYAAETEPRRVQCRYMIDALNIAVGLHRHAKGAEIAGHNATAAAQARAAEAAEIAPRWVV